MIRVVRKDNRHNVGNREPAARRMYACPTEILGGARLEQLEILTPPPLEPLEGAGERPVEVTAPLGQTSAVNLLEHGFVEGEHRAQTRPQDQLKVG
jgi:hypothetical protein